MQGKTFVLERAQTYRRLVKQLYRYSNRTSHDRCFRSIFRKRSGMESLGAASITGEN
jgi:hypothetical protein